MILSHPSTRILVFSITLGQVIAFRLLSVHVNAHGHASSISNTSFQFDYWFTALFFLFFFRFLICIFAGNIASYLELMEVDSVYLPVPVNFIFIGFDGKGNQGD